MITRGFAEVEAKKNDAWWTHEPIQSIQSFTQPIQNNIVDSKFTCSQTLAKMKANAIDCVLVFKDGVVNNVVTKKNIMNKLVLGAIKPDSLVETAALDRHIRVNLSRDN